MKSTSKILGFCSLFTFGLSLLGSHVNVFSQCTAFAGSDTLVCAAGSISLQGEYNFASPSPVLNIDQNQVNTCMAYFSQPDLAQQFTATSGSICGAGLTFESPATGNLTISLWNALPNNGGNLLATGTVFVENSITGDVFWNSVSLTPNATYYLVFESSAPNNITACIAGSTLNPYAGGILYANAGFSPFPSFDYTFRTFTCPQPSFNITWTGPDITAGANTVSPTINPPVGVHTYIMNVTETVTNCTAVDTLVLTRGENVSSSFTEMAVDSFTWNNVTYTAPGQYQQNFQTVFGCDSVVTLNLTLNYTGINEQHAASLKIFPNPTQDFITMQFDGNLARVEVLDAQGRLIKAQNLNSGEQISFQNEPAGVYFLRWMRDGLTTHHRIIKK